MLYLHEIKNIKADPDCIRRFLKSYDLQLNFYGVRVKDPKTGMCPSYQPLIVSIYRRIGAHWGVEVEI